jgi:hypothetical protein
MKQIYIECKPDERLVKVLGYSTQYITHHSGKYKIFSSLKNLAIL